jgi:hypothetical protein
VDSVLILYIIIVILERVLVVLCLVPSIIFAYEYSS